MNDKTKNVVVTISFIFTIILILFLNIIKKDTSISLSERRRMQQFPELSIDTLLNGSFFEKFEKYTMDQFIQREAFRKLKTDMEISVLKKQDSNNIYQYEDKLIEQIYPLNEKSIINVTNKINEIDEKYLNDTNHIYYTIVPDKNYFVNDNHLKLDYRKLKEVMNRNLQKGNYIDIFDCLDLSCYYNTDSHWKQEKLQKVADRIASNMNLKIESKYEEKEIVDFKGVYAGQLPVKTESDKIRILTNEALENCTVYNYETNKKTKIYNMEKMNALDKYDIYLSGAVPLLEIDNPNGDKDKELIVFRDSYGSSLIPLLVEAYSKITVIDTRYISPKVLGQYVDFNNKDVLFAYSVLLINNSMSLK